MRTLVSLLILVVGFLCIPSAIAQTGSGSGIGPGKATMNGHAIRHAVIESKPEPNWPKTIKAEAELLIVLRAIFRYDGQVVDTQFIETRPKKVKGYSKDEIKDLTRIAIDAASKIKFIPAQKDGAPVSMRMQLEYKFQPEDEGKPPNSPPKSN
jgi:hypothetical protein